MPRAPDGFLFGEGYIMKWFKHVSDSLDDPFIVELLDEFGSDAYLVFFGIIEIYSREFSPENTWKLDVTLPFFHRKLHTSPSKIKKILSKIYKWEVSYCDNRVTIFIPKFKELLDNWTVRKIPKEKETLRSDNVETTQPIRIKNKKKKEYSDMFLSFYSAYPKKVGKDAAWKAWCSRKDIMPDISVLLVAITEQSKSQDWIKDKGQFIPHPATWINAGRWQDEIKTEKSSW